jgi:KaiC/GvpD/RAD55 family RecA-like ATPase
VARLGSGLPEFDKLLGGGLERGTSTLIVGAPGTGKSTLAAQFAAAAAAGGRVAALFIFDESQHTLLSRSASLGIDLRKHIDAGRIEPAVGRRRGADDSGGRSGGERIQRAALDAVARALDAVRGEWWPRLFGQNFGFDKC